MFEYYYVIYFVNATDVQIPSI